MSTELLRRITLDDGGVAQAVLLSDAAGWNQTEADWAVFVRHGTVFGVTSGERLVATAAVLPYGADFGWIAMVLVADEFRRRGIATRLVADCVALLRDAGRVAVLDATEHGAPVYEALGFRTLGGLTRWGGEGHDRPIRGGAIPFALDRAAFGADRGFLLHDFLRRPGSFVCAAADAFGVLRPGRRAWHAGPVVGALPDAEVVVEGMIRAAPGALVIDLLDGGRALESLLTAQDFRAQRRFRRMALGCSSLPGDADRMVAAAGPEFG